MSPAPMSLNDSASSAPANVDPIIVAAVGPSTIKGPIGRKSAKAKREVYNIVKSKLQNTQSILNSLKLNLELEEEKISMKAFPIAPCQNFDDER